MMPEVNIHYSLSEYILEGYRNFELNKIITDNIKINQEYKSFKSKILNKIISNIYFLNGVSKSRLILKLKLLGTIDENEFNQKNYFQNSLLELYDKLKSINHLNSPIKITGYWQNPSCYVDNIKNLKLLFKHNNKYLPSNFKSAKYITIHIRRGDYLENKKTYSVYFSRFSEIQFILGALQLIPREFESIPIYLISDDYDWVRQLIPLISKNLNNQIFVLETKDTITTWSILNNSLINIVSNSTFSYTAALLNTNNLDNKLRCIIPKWFNSEESSFEKGWLSPSGFIDL